MMEMPPAIGGPSAWYGPDFVDRTEWIECLSSAELAEIELASRQLAQSELDWQAASAGDFPLPSFGRRAARILNEVLEGRGFVLFRGLPVESVT
jgi:hypothetical protein